MRRSSLIGKQQSGIYEEFDDKIIFENQELEVQPVSFVLVGSHDTVEAIQFGYKDYEMPLHGKTIDTYSKFAIDADDYLVEIAGKIGTWLGKTRLLWVTFHTAKGKIYGPFGTENHVGEIEEFSLKAEENEEIVALFGSVCHEPLSDHGIGTLGVYFAKRRPRWASIRELDLVGSGGRSFDDLPLCKKDIATITKIIVRSGDILDSLQVFYGNESRPRHGGIGGEEHIIHIEQGDHIKQVMGYYGNWQGAKHILQFGLKTAKGKSYGPFGTMKGACEIEPFHLAAEKDEEIIGFFGAMTTHKNGCTGIASLGVGAATFKRLDSEK